jgi:glycine/D-amino acid oxidase-like deaminating enzyme
MQHEYTDTAVVGLGAAGTAIVHELARQGVQVIGLDRGDGTATSLNNQKWKHSGLLYQRQDVARHLWDAFVGMQPLEQRHLRNRGGQFLVCTDETLHGREALWSDWGIPFQRLPGVGFAGDELLGKPRCAGGFLTADSVMDFPALLPDLRRDAERMGAHIVARAAVQRLVRDADKVTGIVYEKDGYEVLLHCRHCVLAMGGWAPEALRQVGVELPVRRWKSHVVTVEGELVDRITAFLDPPGLTLVPYKGRTLIADTRRASAADGDDHNTIGEAVEALQADLAACFPALRWRALKLSGVHA